MTIDIRTGHSICYIVLLHNSFLYDSRNSNNTEQVNMIDTKSPYL